MWHHPLVSLPLSSLVPNAALILVTTYSAFYLVLEPLAGLTWALVIGLPLWLTATTWMTMVRAFSG